MGTEAENKISFLTSAISDAQELIRVTDAKLGVVITILGAYIIAFFSAIEKISKYCMGYNIVFWLSLSFFLLLLIICIIIATRIIKPTHNPNDNINFGGYSQPSLKFFLSPNKYPKYSFYTFRNSKKFKLTEDIKNYAEILTNSKETDIINALTLELFKLSYIRNIKSDRFSKLLWWLLFTTVFFFLTYIIFTIQTENAIDTIEKMRQYHFVFNFK